MPYAIRKLPKQNLYRVYNKETKAIHSYGTTLENAKKQVALLNSKKDKELEIAIKNDANIKKARADNKSSKSKLEKIKESLGQISKVLEGGGIIDRETTGVLRKKLTKGEKDYINDEVLPIISKTTIRNNKNRVNSGEGRSQVFGYGNRRQRGFGEYSNNSKFSELWRVLALLGKKIVPSYIAWTAIQVNHNYQTKKHIDGNNIGLSLSISFGDFTGGELVIGDKEYQTKLHPVIFNGALTEHFNKTISGNRYSLVYFISAPKDATDEDIVKLHNKLMDKVEGMKSGGSIETDLFEEEGIVSLPEFKSVKIDLPTYMYKRNPDIKGNPPPYRYRLVVPITKIRHLASRKALGTAVEINQKPIGKPRAEIVESEEQPTYNDFSPSDRAKIKAYYDAVKENEEEDINDIPNDPYEIKERGRPCMLPKNCRRQGKSSKASSKVSAKASSSKKKLIIEEDSDEEEVIPKPKAKRGRPPKPKKVLQIEGDDEPEYFEIEVAPKKAKARAPPNSPPPVSADVVKAVKAKYAPVASSLDDFDPDAFLAELEGKGINNMFSYNKKMPNKWITFVKEYSIKHNIPYKDALKDSKCKDAYKSGDVIIEGAGKNKPKQVERKSLMKDFNALKKEIKKIQPDDHFDILEGAMRETDEASDFSSEKYDNIKISYFSNEGIKEVIENLNNALEM